MSQQHDDDNFGEESFLDILANMVGILVILIVLAGVRVSMSHLAPDRTEHAEIALQAPVEETIPDWPVMPLTSANSNAPAFLVAKPEVLPEPLPKLYHLNHERDQEPHVSVTPHLGQPIAESTPTDKTASQLQQLLHQYNQANDQLQAQQAAYGTLFTNSREQKAELDAMRLEYEQLKPKLAALTADSSQLETQALSYEDQLRFLQTQMVLIERSSPQVKQWEHIASAIANEVKGEEHHFLIRGQQIAYVPLNELLDLAKSQIQKRRDWFRTHESYESIVGPVEGFTMQVRVVKQGGSTIEDLRYSGAFIRIELDEFRVLPSSDVKRETENSALSPTSIYRDRLLNFEPGATVTFWVYPDSFGTYQSLQQEARKLGLKVAARPLNRQEFLTGGRNGRKTMSQ